jgi:uncharacterized protein YbaA (DUF1428 family)
MIRTLPAFLLTATLMICLDARFAPAQTSPPTNDLEFQVAALTTLDELDLTTEQLKSLQTLARDAAAKTPLPPAEGNDQYRAALLALRDAFVAGDDEKIEPAQEKVEDLRDSRNIEPDLDIADTDQARAKAAAALKLLTSSQIAAYIAAYADDVPDAEQTISDALDQCKDGSDTVFAAMRDEASEQVGLLLAGMDQAKSKVAAQKVADLLDKARKMTAAALESHRAELDREAKRIVGGADSFDELHHWMLGEMADLLSNPRLATVLSARIAADNQG